MPEQEAVKGNKDALMERLRGKYPDREWADDEELYGQIGEDYDAYDDELNGYKEREQTLTDMFNKDPRSAQFITDMARGEDPWLAMIRRVGVDGMSDLLNDPSKQEAFAEANKEYVDRLAKEKELEQEYEGNLAESLTQLERIQQERGLTDEQIDAAYDLIGKIANEALVGIFSEESVDMALKALNYDTAVEEAGAEGEVRGKNTKVEAMLRKPDRSDGTVVLGGANNSPQPERRNRSIFEIAEDA